MVFAKNICYNYLGVIFILVVKFHLYILCKYNFNLGCLCIIYRYL